MGFFPSFFRENEWLNKVVVSVTRKEKKRKVTSKVDLPTVPALLEGEEETGRIQI